jgi:hypothetical protein
MANFRQSLLKTIPLVLALLLFSGCQLTMKDLSNNTSYGEYYLTLRQLTPLQLSEEVNKQQAKVMHQSKASNLNDYDAKIKLLLLYCLPASPIYNSFNAKALLNEMHSGDDNTAFADITPSDQALFSLLRDQLNQQLLMRNRLLAEQKAQRALALKQQQALTEQVQLLEQTIKQLKNIEQAIDKRAQ